MGGLHANLSIYSINLISSPHTGLRKVSEDQWTCEICKDGTQHAARHLSRHLESKRHKNIVKHRSQAPLLTDQDEGEHASMYVTQSSNEVILNVGAPSTVSDTPAEVSYGLYLCDRRLMTFTE